MQTLKHVDAKTNGGVRSLGNLHCAVIFTSRGGLLRHIDVFATAARGGFNNYFAVRLIEVTQPHRLTAMLC